MLPGGCFSSFPTEECYISALQTALRCWNPSPWGRDFYSRQLCPLKHQPVNWMGVGNTFGMQLHNHYSHTTATEDCCCNTLSLSPRFYFFSFDIRRCRQTPQAFMAYSEKNIFRNENQKQCNGRRTTSSSSEMPVKNCHPQCFSPLNLASHSHCTSVQQHSCSPRSWRRVWSLQGKWNEKPKALPSPHPDAKEEIA